MKKLSTRKYCLDFISYRVFEDPGEFDEAKEWKFSKHLVTYEENKFLPTFKSLSDPKYIFVLKIIDFI